MDNIGFMANREFITEMKEGTEIIRFFASATGSRHLGVMKN